MTRKAFQKMYNINMYIEKVSKKALNGKICNTRMGIGYIKKNNDITATSCFSFEWQ